MDGSDVYISPIEVGYCGPGTPPKPAPIRGQLVGIEDGPDGTLTLLVFANDGKIHRFNGCYIASWSASMSEKDPNTVRLENISLVEAGRSDGFANEIQVQDMAIPVSMLHGVNEKVAPYVRLPLPMPPPMPPREDLPIEPNKNSDVIAPKQNTDQERRAVYLFHVALSKSHSVLEDAKKEIMQSQGPLSPTIQSNVLALNFVLATIEHARKIIV